MPTNAELMQQRDDRVAKQRAGQRDAEFTSLNPAQSMYFDTFNNMQEDAATGPAGYNRQWVPLLESLAGKRFVGGGGLPTETYADPQHTGHLTLQPRADPNAPMPLDQDAFTAQYEKQHAAPTPTNTLKQRALKVSGGPVGRVPTPDPISASPSPPGTPFSLDGMESPPLDAWPSPPGATFSLDALQQRARGRG